MEVMIPQDVDTHWVQDYDNGEIFAIQDSSLAVYTNEMQWEIAPGKTLFRHPLARKLTQEEIIELVPLQMEINRLSAQSGGFDASLYQMALDKCYKDWSKTPAEFIVFMEALRKNKVIPSKDQQVAFGALLKGRDVIEPGRVRLTDLIAKLKALANGLKAEYLKAGNQRVIEAEKAVYRRKLEVEAEVKASAKAAK